MFYDNISYKQHDCYDYGNPKGDKGDAIADINQEVVEELHNTIIQRKSAIVLAIPYDGVVTEDIITRTLSCRLGIIISRVLRDPDNEYGIGATMEDGTTYIDQAALNHYML